MISKYQNIEFLSQKVTLRGRLYLPDAQGPLAIVVMAHGFTSTISGMTADKYAEGFQRAGIAALLYDHRNFGISDGEPRQEVNFWLQTRSYIDAVEYIRTRKEIDSSKIALWGASMSAREAFLAGCVNEYVSAVITLIPAFGDVFPEVIEGRRSIDYATETLELKYILDLPHKLEEPTAIVSHDQINAPSRLTELTAFRWFMEYGGRFGTNWKNTVSYSILDTPTEFNVGLCAPYIKAPVLMIVAKNDEMQGASPDVSASVFNLIDQPKEWIDIVGGHFGLLYHPSPLFNLALQGQIAFLMNHLKLKEQRHE